MSMVRPIRSPATLNYAQRPRQFPQGDSRNVQKHHILAVILDPLSGLPKVSEVHRNLRYFPVTANVFLRRNILFCSIPHLARGIRNSRGGTRTSSDMRKQVPPSHGPSTTPYPQGKKQKNVVLLGQEWFPFQGELVAVLVKYINRDL